MTEEKISEQHGTGRKFVIRTFTDTVTKEEYLQLQERGKSLGYREHQLMHVLEGHGWCMRERGYMPIELEQGKDYNLKGSLEKGISDLVVRIQIT